MDNSGSQTGSPLQTSTQETSPAAGISMLNPTVDPNTGTIMDAGASPASTQLDFTPPNLNISNAAPQASSPLVASSTPSSPVTEMANTGANNGFLT